MVRKEVRACGQGRAQAVTSKRCLRDQKQARARSRKRTYWVSYTGIWRRQRARDGGSGGAVDGAGGGGGLG